ncbi:MAG: AAA family ATPase [Bacteroidota bacterium]|nr:AAA family ATPase [Bacteroidota bacterium]MXW15179.1 DUF3696 domain-containing protein [Rhodothermaceae bacterium]MDE2646439.1 AAA family ATPase [Bacteroidota bacterium]MXW33756.1 DUF3696 domain-containing protein [Rhodothermaceae bacterium]MYC03068.1 DUF3696 domain-containing protein [Rhodothermaceae bacterium]
MKEITLENFRCFHTKQVARLAPLTLLVGENSTGKTSFMAMIRALWDCAYGHRIPDFKEAPFDLGSFEEIAHRRSERNVSEATFRASLQIDDDLGADVEFGKKGKVAVPRSMGLVDGKIRIKDKYDAKGEPKMQVKTPNGVWEMRLATDITENASPLLTLRGVLLRIPELIFRDFPERPIGMVPIHGSPPFSKSDIDAIAGFRLLDSEDVQDRPYAGAPVRARPQRTYDPDSLMEDSEGNYVPMLLEHLATSSDARWTSIKEKLEHFGSSTGIFDEIDIKRLGKSESAPFQVQVRKYGKKRRGIKQNLIDVGYGISQALPILMELLPPGISRMALLQQPEVHLHPSAQAALGSLFCETAGQGRQLVVETHSDHLMDRVRMDVRDGKTNLRPEDVSILFFERNDLSVQIHSIRIDEEGNILDAPNNYRQFFMEETRRSLWG